MTDTSPEAVERLRGEVMTLEHLGGTWVTAEDYFALAAKLEFAEAARATARGALLNIAAAKHPDEPSNPYKQMARDALALIERKP